MRSARRGQPWREASQGSTAVWQASAWSNALTAGARLIAVAQAGLITPLEVVLGPISMWLIYRDQPDGLALAGGAVVLAAVPLHAVADLRPTRLRAGAETL